jgi:hypothetical protein
VPIPENARLMRIESARIQEAIRNSIRENLRADTHFRKSGFNLMVMRESANDLLYNSHHSLISPGVDLKAILAADCNRLDVVE